MALICTTVTTWVNQTVLDQVDTWVSQQEEKCKKKKWWNPATWICWFVTILVKVISWITRTILVPILKTICTVITGILGGILYPFAWAIDSVCQTCNAHQWVELWWLSPTKIKFVKKEESPNNPRHFDYTFICKCKNGDKKIIVTASNDGEAAQLATVKCKATCK